MHFDTYERLVEEAGGPGVRFTFDQGRLEIMTVSRRHEQWKKTLARMVEAMTEELDIPISSGGSLTLKRRELQKGAEPDECYWVHHERAMRGRLEFDPHTDPAPDLAIESEVSRGVLDRLGILATLGVSEIWRYDGERLTILLRTADGAYVESPTSRCFPWLPVEEFRDRMRGPDEPETTWIRGFREWVRTRPRDGGA